MNDTRYQHLRAKMTGEINLLTHLRERLRDRIKGRKITGPAALDDQPVATNQEPLELSMHEPSGLALGPIGMPNRQPVLGISNDQSAPAGQRLPSLYLPTFGLIGFPVQRNFSMVSNRQAWKPKRFKFGTLKARHLARNHNPQLLEQRFGNRA